MKRGKRQPFKAGNSENKDVKRREEEKTQREKTKKRWKEKRGRKDTKRKDKEKMEREERKKVDVSSARFNHSAPTVVGKD
jgi:hypothetical protein